MVSLGSGEIDPLIPLALSCSSRYTRQTQIKTKAPGVQKSIGVTLLDEFDALRL